MEIEEEKAETAEEAAAESETPDAEKEPEVDKTALTEQINGFGGVDADGLLKKYLTP